MLFASAAQPIKSNRIKPRSSWMDHPKTSDNRIRQVEISTRRYIDLPAARTLRMAQVGFTR